MKSYHFYLEYPSKAAKRAATRKNLGNHSGNIIAVDSERANSWLSDRQVMRDCVSAVTSYPNSDVCGSSASMDYIRENCKRVSEKQAREIHPNLFSTLESWEKSAVEGQKAVERERNGQIEIETIDVQAKQWFDRVNGNSYFSAVVTVNFQGDDETVLVCPMQYGYGECYLQAARAALVEAGFLVGSDIGLVRWCRESGVRLCHSIEHKCKQREVKEWGTL